MATLFVVATPIGNLDDLSPRAARILSTVPVVFAEDTRHSGRLMQHIGATARLVSLHEHNERSREGLVLETLGAGDAALVSDAGTPAVSDPGALVVAAVAAAGHKIEPIPGPSALIASLSAAGFVMGEAGTLFLGFAPAKGKERQAALERAVAFAGVVVLFEAPHRAAETLAELAALDPSRPAVVARELTKIHEELRRDSLAGLAQWAQGDVRGELVFVLGPKAEVAPEAPDEAAVERALDRCFSAGLSVKDAAAAVAAILERPKRDVYQRALARRPG